MERNWEEIGIVWDTDEVARGTGNDKRVIGIAQLPVIDDLDKFVQHFGTAAVIGPLNGTSHRVQAQAVARREIEKNLAKPPAARMERDRFAEHLREQVYLMLRGIRATPSRATQVFVAPLPDGSTWRGNEVDEYERSAAAMYVDSGVPSALALTLAKNAADAIRKQK